VPDQSTVVQTGGIAYVHWTYSIEGQFELTVDPNAGTASFAHVDANATDDSPFKRTLDPNHVFNMTSLVGTVVDNTTIKFTGKASDGSDVLITATLQDDVAHLIGQTTPPPNSADFFIFNLDAVAQRKYGGGSGTAEDPYQIATAEDLILLGDSPQDYDKRFILTADIDLDPNLPGRKVFDKAVIAPDTDPGDRWAEFQGTPFTGVFDGNGCMISHLTIKGGTYVGLFGRLASGAEVRHLGVVDVNITGSGAFVGALAGYNGGAVTQCYSTGPVSGDSAVGGLVGWNSATATHCYSTGAVNGSECVGGLVGYNSGALTQCYSIGAVSGTGIASSLVGGLVGFDYGAVTQCFWDAQTSGQSNWSRGGVGKTTADMQDIRTYLDAGWDFLGETKNGTSQIWQMPEAGGYPVLAIFNGYTPPQLKGQGTAQDPYLISNALELGAMVHYSPYAHYRLAGSIGLSGTRWTTAVIPWFAGTFDGNGLTISHLTIDGGEYLGLFGQLASGTKVEDLGLVDVNVVGSGGFVGGLSGEQTVGHLLFPSR
jgi:hypothetical protein